MVTKLAGLPKEHTLNDLFFTHEEVAAMRHNYDDQVETLNSRMLLM